MKFLEIPELVKIKSMYSFIVRKAHSKFYFSGESHPFWEMVYVADGSVGVTADKRVYTLKKGEMIFHKPMEFHRIWSQEGTAPRYYVFSFTAEGSALEKIKDMAIKCTDEMQSLMTDVVNMRNEAFFVENEWLISGIRNAEKAFICVSKLENLLCLASVVKESLKFNDDKDAVLFGKAVSFLYENISGRVSVQELANHCFVSPSKIKKVFAKYVACGISEYFTYMKITEAQRLLQQGLPVGEVSETLGFSNQFYFSSVFRKIATVTPSAYKRQWKKK